jgi:hypothetical protein
MQKQSGASKPKRKKLTTT